MKNTAKQPVNRIQRRATQTRRKLKEATLDILSEKTIDAVTVEEITQKADVGKGTLYQHFSDKEDIVLTLIDEAMHHLLARIRAYKKKPDGLEGMLEHMLDAHYGFCMECREEFLLLFQGKLLLKLQSDTMDELEEPYLCYLHEIESEISSYLSPKIDPMKVRRLACAVAGFVFGFLSFGIIAMSEQEIDTSIKPLRRVFVKSMCTFLGRWDQDIERDIYQNHIDAYEVSMAKKKTKPKKWTKKELETLQALLLEKRNNILGNVVSIYTTYYWNIFELTDYS